MKISARKTTLALLLIALLLTGAHVVLQLIWADCGGGVGCERLLRMLDVNAENNLPTWFASSCWLIAGVLTAFIASTARSDVADWRRHWIGLSVTFIFLSFDEAATFHELFGGLIGDKVGAASVLYYSWLLYGLVFVGIVAFLYIRFIIALPTLIRWLFVLSGALFLTGAVGLEFLGGAAEMGDFHFIRNERWIFAVALEELFEMLGVILLIYTLLLCLARSPDGVHMRVSHGTQAMAEAIAGRRESAALNRSMRLNLAPFGRAGERAQKRPPDPRATLSSGHLHDGGGGVREKG